LDLPVVGVKPTPLMREEETRMRNKQLGEALFEIGSHAAGWTGAILVLFGGSTALFASTDTYIQKPFVQVLAWGQILVLSIGLISMAVGHVLRKVSDPSNPSELVARVQRLEQEVAHLRAQLESDPPSGSIAANSGEARITSHRPRS
jgi:hypothetical protein